VLDSQDVTTTIVAGRVLMLERQVLSLDEASLRRDVRTKRDEIQAVLAASRGQP
jgi:hypothetical protein